MLFIKPRHLYIRQVKEKELLDLGLHHDTFDRVSVQKIREYFHRDVKVNDWLGDSLLTLHRKNKHQTLPPYLMMLWLVHVGMQERPTLMDVTCVLRQLNTILQVVNTIPQKKGQTPKAKFKSFIQEILQHSPSQNYSQKQPIVSKQKYLLTRIIRPYLSYLLKLLPLTRLHSYNYRLCEQLEVQQVWSIFNIFQYMNKSKEHFNQAIRYYGPYCYDAVLVLVRLLVKDVMMLYPMLKIYVQREKQHFSQVRKVEQVDRLNNLLRVMEEVATLNEHILELVKSKYYMKQIEEGQLVQDMLIDIQAEPYQYVHSLKQSIK